MDHPHDSHPQPWEKLFPRDIPGRIALALVGLLFAPISGSVLFAMLFGPGGRNADWWVRLLLVEVSLAFFIWSVVGLIWSIATPRWLESALHQVALRLLIAIFVGFSTFGVVAMWAIFRV